MLFKQTDLKWPPKQAQLCHSTRTHQLVPNHNPQFYKKLQTLEKVKLYAYWKELLTYIYVGKMLSRLNMTIITQLMYIRRYIGIKSRYNISNKLLLICSLPDLNHRLMPLSICTLLIQSTTCLWSFYFRVITWTQQYNFEFNF